MPSFYLLPLRFHLTLILRLILISGTILLFIAFFEKLRDEYLYITFFLGLTFILQIYLLYRFLTKMEKDLNYFLLSLLNDDITGHYGDDKGLKGFIRFRNLLDQVNEIIKLKSNAIEQHRILFEIVVNEAPSGILLYDQNGVALLHNPALLKMTHLTSVLSTADLDKLKRGLTCEIDELEPGRSVITKLFVDNQGKIAYEPKVLLIKKAVIRGSKKTTNLLTFIDIYNELNSNELEAWQKLMRVLTHEIMNSISPLTALSKRIEAIAEEDTSEEKMDKILKGMKTIRKSGDHLLCFLNEYRDLNNVSKPRLSEVILKDFLEHVICLFKGEFPSDGIKISLIVEPDGMKESIDPAMMEKVIYNLLKNSYQSIGSEKEGVIKVSALKNKDLRTILRIEDNGPGFTGELADKMFIPFFTTKKNGSGIGLSISHQIVNLHGGIITASSLPGKSTVFTIKL